jgi:hypothetical protein
MVEGQREQVIFGAQAEQICAHRWAYSEVEGRSRSLGEHLLYDPRVTQVVAPEAERPGRIRDQRWTTLDRRYAAAQDLMALHEGGQRSPQGAFVQGPA